MYAIRPALVLLGLFSLLTGVVYPLLVTGVAQALFAEEANGSLLKGPVKLEGSRLIGQPFSAKGYFWSRPSATSPVPYNGASSSGSNLGPTNPALIEAVKQRIVALQESGAADDAPVPIDLVTTSASGLDPHISPAAARYQVRRVAAARGIAEEQVRELVEANTEPRTLGILGEPRVNVLELNLALDQLR